MIEVTPYLFSGFTANTYLCRDTQSGRGLVIDPGADAAAIEILANEKVESILLTHAHFDHALIAAKLAEKTGAGIYLHRLDAPLLADPDKNASACFGSAPLRAKADRLLEDGDEIRLGESVFTVLHTPGHSPGSVCFLCGDLLFTGDTLFFNDYGRTDLYGGNEEDLAVSLERLSSLKGVLRVFPGHDTAFFLSDGRACLSKP